MTKRPIDTSAHRSDRARYLKAHPLCERCLARGEGRPAYILHHRDGNQLNREWGNFEALCNDCHEIEHRRMAAGCDTGGNPIDPRHPWNRGRA